MAILLNGEPSSFANRNSDGALVELASVVDERHRQFDRT
jgi:hypothetical protein